MEVVAAGLAIALHDLVRLQSITLQHDSKTDLCFRWSRSPVKTSSQTLCSSASIWKTSSTLSKTPIDASCLVLPYYSLCLNCYSFRFVGERNLSVLSVTNTQFRKIFGPIVVVDKTIRTLLLPSLKLSVGDYISSTVQKNQSRRHLCFLFRII